MGDRQFQAHEEKKSCVVLIATFLSKVLSDLFADISKP
jgi:hypothetical protein